MLIVWMVVTLPVLAYLAVCASDEWRYRRRMERRAHRRNGLVRLDRLVSD